MPLLPSSGYDAAHMPNHAASASMVAFAYKGDAAGVLRELDSGADSNAVHGTFQHCALYRAARNGHADVCAVLLAAGANVNKCTSGGRTAMFAASRGGHIAVLRKLILAGGDVNLAKNNGTTPLLVASEEGRCGALQLLLQSGAGCEGEHVGGMYPLHYAAHRGRLGVVEVLLMVYPRPRPWFTFLVGCFKARPAVGTGTSQGTGGACRGQGQGRRQGQGQDQGQGQGQGPAKQDSSRARQQCVRQCEEQTQGHGREAAWVPRGGSAMQHLYTPELLRLVWSFLHKPRYVALDQQDRLGRTALQVRVRERLPWATYLSHIVSTVYEL